MRDKGHETSIRALLTLIPCHLLPLWIVLTYTKIPAGIRATHLPGPSTSATALEGIRAGHGWKAVTAAVKLRW